MPRLSAVGRALLLLLGLFVPASLGLRANPTTEESRMTDLIRKLGADAFDTRESATRELAGLGKKAVKALQEGLKNPDMEVARRCSELLERANRSALEAALDGFLENRDEKQLLQVPAWPKFSRLVGDTAPARNLFVMMCTSDGALIDAAEQNIDKASTLYNQRMQLIQQRMNQPWFGGVQPEYATIGELAALLYVGTDSRIRIEQNLRYMVNNLLHQPRTQQWLRGDGTARKLLAGYIESRSDVNLIHNHLYLVQNFEIRECLNWVGKVAEGKGQQPYVRATAIATLGKLGGKEVLPKLEAFFTDSTQLTTFQQPGMGQIRTEVRDIALAMAVLASGQNLVSYGYPWLVHNATNLAQNPQMPYHSAFQLGFADAKQRDAAFTRYKEWKAKQGMPEAKN